jgi:membrane fusion protein (multidrug efflux system)
MWKKIFAVPAFLAAVVFCGCEKKAPPPQTPEVFVQTVQPQDMAVHQQWIGTMDGLVNAQIHAQVTGYLTKQDYAEGTRVKAGDPLFEIDPRPFVAAVDQAEAKLAEDKAQYEKAELDVKRYTPLAKAQAVSEETAIDAVQASLAAKAQVKADEAAIETAKLNLGWTHITSPVDGVAGIALGQLGDLVGPAGPLLTTVSTVDPIKVYFQVNEQDYLTFWEKYISIMDTNSADLKLDLILSDGSTYAHKGRLYSADRQINTTTGTLQVVAVFPNPESTLRPGQYGLVQAMTKMETNVFVIPQRAVAELQGSYQVAVVVTNVAHLRNVQVGRQIGSDWIIESGLKPGDQIVVEGTLKAREGAKVNPQPMENSATNSAATNSPPQ